MNRPFTIILLKKEQEDFSCFLLSYSQCEYSESIVVRACEKAGTIRRPRLQNQKRVGNIHYQKDALMPRGRKNITI